MCLVELPDRFEDAFTPSEVDALHSIIDLDSVNDARRCTCRDHCSVAGYDALKSAWSARVRGRTGATFLLYAPGWEKSVAQEFANELPAVLPAWTSASVASSRVELRVLAALHPTADVFFVAEAGGEVDDGEPPVTATSRRFVFMQHSDSTEESTPGPGEGEVRFAKRGTWGPFGVRLVASMIDEKCSEDRMAGRLGIHNIRVY